MSGAVERIAIVGDGLAGWCAALALRRAFGSTQRVTVIAADVADPPLLASAPDFALLLSLLGLLDGELLARTASSLRLGTRWRARDGRVAAFLPIADTLPMPDGIDLHHQRRGDATALAAYDRLAVAAASGRVVPGATGFHVDVAGLTALLRDRALAAGVLVAGRYRGHESDADGRVRAVVSDAGAQVAADFFLDASGTARLLLRDAPGVTVRPGGPACCVGTQMQAAAVPGPPRGERVFTATGWIDTAPLADRLVTKTVRIDPAGARRPDRLERRWLGNVVAIGEAGGVVTGCDGATLALLQKSVTQLVQLFPATLPADALAREYDHRLGSLHEWYADAAALAFRMVEPAAGQGSARLARRVALFGASGRLTAGEDDPWPRSTWVAAMTAAGIVPRHPHPLAPALPDDWFDDMAARLAIEAAGWPTHAELLECSR